MQRQVYSRQFHHLFLIDMGESGNTSRKAHLTTDLTAADEPPILLIHMQEAAGTATDIPMLASGIAEDESVWRGIACHH